MVTQTALFVTTMMVVAGAAVAGEMKGPTRLLDADLDKVIAGRTDVYLYSTNEFLGGGSATFATPAGIPREHIPEVYTDTGAYVYPNGSEQFPSGLAVDVWPVYVQVNP